LLPRPLFLIVSYTAALLFPVATGISFALTKNRPTADFSAANQISQLVTAAP
jgi:hypothetical protein